jgi:hypothetical protein
MCCTVWVLTEAAVVIPAMTHIKANYVEGGSESGGIAWARTHTAPTELLLTNRGADLALWTPNRVARLPRLPHSAHRTTTLPELDALADRMGARYMVHFRGYPAEAKYDREEFEFVRQFDDAASFGARVVAVLPDSIVYRVGSREAGP